MTTVGYIGGYGRSGSTLLETVLAGFDDACVLGEIVHLWSRGVAQNLPCGCGQPFDRCPFWQEIGAQAFGGWRAADAQRMQELQQLVDRNRFLPANAVRRGDSERADAMHEYAAGFTAIYDAAATVTGARVVVDSSKHASTAWILRREPDLDLRVLHLVRDSRGVAYSWTKPTFFATAPDGSDIYMPQYSPARSAYRWVSQNAYFDLLGRTSTPVLRLRYEELLAAPVDTAHRLATYLGLSGERVTDFVSATQVQRHETHQISGNPIRFTSGPMTLRPDEAWRTEFPERDRRLVTRLTAPQMLRYGYKLAEPNDRAEVGA